MNSMFERKASDGNTLCLAYFYVVCKLSLFSMAMFHKISCSLSLSRIFIMGECILLRM
jgi:hypothetical protein